MLKKFGPMRMFLVAVASVLIVVSFYTDTMVNSNNKMMLYVCASLVPIMMFVILFDVMMNRIQIADKKDQPELQRQYRINGHVELAFTIVMVLVWLPFFNSLI